ncbi:MAG: cobalt transporter [Oscillospiraceae bacterium]|nr:cobalt transporter [Oscillospiraceae bacterium]
MHEYGHHHDHEHDQEHEHEHDHTHSADCQGDCGHDCAACSQDPKAELLALMNYMVKHNTAHCAELEGLGKQLKELGMEQAYEQVLQAVSDFEKGNLRLSTVLASLQ